MVSTAEKPQTKKLIAGGDPDAPFNPPTEEQFVNEAGEKVEFLEADSLQRIASLLVERRPSLGVVRNFNVIYAWRRKGGSLHGLQRYGKTERLGALDKWLGEHDFVVWLAADHLNGATAWKVEAELFTAMCAIGATPKGLPTLNYPDFSNYHAVVQEYGSKVREEIRVLAEQLKFGEMEE